LLEGYSNVCLEFKVFEPYLIFQTMGVCKTIESINIYSRGGVINYSLDQGPRRTWCRRCGVKHSYQVLEGD
jgi:hypothetical protein